MTLELFVYSSNMMMSNQLCQPMAAKNIAVKMLAAVSNNPKLQADLAKPRFVHSLNKFSIVTSNLPQPLS